MVSKDAEWVRVFTISDISSKLGITSSISLSSASTNYKHIYVVAFIITVNVF